MAPTCESCQRLRLKCKWEAATSFSPTCERCDKYGLDCLIDSKKWPAKVQERFMDTVLHGSSRNVFWGPESNAAGHPVDLHGNDQMPPAPSTYRSNSTSQPPPGSTKSASCVLNINRNVKRHFMSIYFEHIQPRFPIVTQYSLQAYPPTPLLEAVIYGIAAKHHLAIASWRDVEHIRDFIRQQLKTLFGLRTDYKPKIQTVQALLLACYRIELLSRDYSDFLGLETTPSLICKMAQDLNLEQSLTAEDASDDTLFRQQLWAGCLVQDAYQAAVFGQPCNIHQEAWAVLKTVLIDPAMKDGFGENTQPAAVFKDTMLLSYHLRQILHRFFATRGSPPDELYSQATAILQEINHTHIYIESKLTFYTRDASQMLQMFQHHNRLLFALGLKLSLNDESSHRAQMKQMLDEQNQLVVLEACSTLSQLDSGFLQSPYVQFGFPLYFVVRALFVVVGSLNNFAAMAFCPPNLVQRLKSGVASARALSEEMLADDCWGSPWVQGQTIRGILSHLKFSDEPIQQSAEQSQTVMDLGTLNAQGQQDLLREINLDAELSDALLLPNDWDILMDEQFGLGVWYGSQGL